MSTPNEKIEPKKKRQPRIIERMQLNDKSCKPGLELMEAIAFVRTPRPEDLAVLNAWEWFAAEIDRLKGPPHYARSC